MSTIFELFTIGIKPLLDAVAQLVDQVAALKKQVEDLLNQNASLKAQLEQARRRSHRQAAPFSKDQQAAHPKRPGRKPGRGPFTFRTGPPPDSATGPAVDVRLSKPICPCCGLPLEVDRVESASTTEIPPQPRPVVRLDRVHVYRCSSCGTRVRASHPDLAADQYGATAHRLGPRVIATAHVLHYGVGICVRKVPQVLRMLTGVELTQSAITQDAHRRAAQGVGQEYEDLRAEIARADVVHTDDTGWRIGGVPAFLMTFETDTATVYQIRDHHRNEEVREVIPTDYPGVMVTDRGTTYDAHELSGIKQQKYLAHVLRSIDQVLAKPTGKALWFGRHLKQLLREALTLWHEFSDGKVDESEYRRRGERLKEELTEHLTPRELSDADNQRLLNELGWHHARGNLVRFLDEPSVPPTNNAAERALRPAVIARKVSQCSKTDGGAKTFGAFCSVIRTAAKRGRDAVDWLCTVFRRAEARAAPS
jgi:transposase